MGNDSEVVPRQPLALATSLSNGELAYLQVDDNGNPRVVDTWQAHDYEPWITTWNYHDPNLLFSGDIWIFPTRFHLVYPFQVGTICR